MTQDLHKTVTSAATTTGLFPFLSTTRTRMPQLYCLGRMLVPKDASGGWHRQAQLGDGPYGCSRTPSPRPSALTMPPSSLLILCSNVHYTYTLAPRNVGGRPIMLRPPAILQSFTDGSFSFVELTDLRLGEPEVVDADVIDQAIILTIHLACFSANIKVISCSSTPASTTACI